MANSAPTKHSEREALKEAREEARDERTIRARKKGKIIRPNGEVVGKVIDEETGLVRRTSEFEPDVKTGASERHLWKIMELIPEGRDYTAMQRFDALVAYASTGDVYEVPKLVPGLSVDTVRSWKHSADWWKPALRQIREYMNEEFDGRLTHIMNKSLEEMQDRLANGDEHVTKDGSVVRKKVAFRDLAVGGIAIPFDKRNLGRGEPTARMEHTTDKERLAKLQEQFKQIAKGRIINITPEEGK